MQKRALQASHTLEDLLSTGGHSQLRGTAHRASRKFDDQNHPYWAMDIDEREAFHGEMKLAESVGAVALEWSKFGGDDKSLVRVRLIDVDRLAAHLGQQTEQHFVSQARATFEPWIGDAPRLADVLGTWEAGKLVRKQGPKSAPEFVEAARVIAHMAGQRAELPVRVASRYLFRDSKRIESLVPVIDVLTSEVWPALQNHREDVLSSIGLRAAPLPFHMAGCGNVRLAVSGLLRMVYEYVAVSPGQVVGYHGRPNWILSIENLTTFSMVSKMPLAKIGGLALYTGGMPSPSWRRAFAAIVRDVDQEVPIYHWGDFDEGGFRIASVIALTIAPRGLRPWLMDPRLLVRTDPSTKAIRSRMAYGARRARWEELAAVIESIEPCTMEQEDQDVVLPTKHG